MPKSTHLTCENGHKFSKRSDCHTCPICEQERKPQAGFLSLISAPARRALENRGIDSLGKFALMSEKELLQLHGIGESVVSKLQVLLAEKNLSFGENLKSSQQKKLHSK